MVKEIVKDLDILAKKSEEFILGEDDDLIIDMIDTANAHADRCVGLAAVQIGVHKRVILVKVINKFVPFINPVIVRRNGGVYKATEGCLSLDGTRTVTRHKKIMVKYTTENGRTKILTVDGYTAQIIQHECDHLDGVLI